MSCLIEPKRGEQGLVGATLCPVITVEAYGSIIQRYIIDGTVSSVQINWFNLWSDKSTE